MRLVTAAISGLLISASSPALSQGLQNTPIQRKSGQNGTDRAEPQRCEPQQVALQQAVMDGGEPEQAGPAQSPILLTWPQPAQPKQADRRGEPDAEERPQTESQPQGKPQSGTSQQADQREIGQDEMHRPSPQQAEGQQGEPQQGEVGQAETHQTEPQQAERQQPEPSQREPQQREIGQDETDRPVPQQPVRQQAEPQRAERQGKTESTAPQEGMHAPPPQDRLPRDAKWTVFIEPSLGTRLDVPSAVFSMSDGPSSRGVGRQFRTPDGRAAVSVYSQRNAERDTPASYLRKNFRFQGVVDYKRVTTDFFAISGIGDGTIYYRRCNISRWDGAIHCFDLKYPAQEKNVWNGIVTRMSRSLRPLNRS